MKQKDLLHYTSFLISNSSSKIEKWQKCGHSEDAIWEAVIREYIDFKKQDIADRVNIFMDEALEIIGKIKITHASTEALNIEYVKIQKKYGEKLLELKKRLEEEYPDEIYENVLVPKLSDFSA